MAVDRDAQRARVGQQLANAVEVLIQRAKDKAESRQPELLVPAAEEIDEQAHDMYVRWRKQGMRSIGSLEAELSDDERAEIEASRRPMVLTDD